MKQSLKVDEKSVSDMSMDCCEEVRNTGEINNGLDPSARNQFSSTIGGIAICSVGELFGGVERHVLGMLAGLSDSEVKPILLLFHDGELAEQARELSIEPIIMPSGSFASLLSVYRLAKIFARYHVTIVHVHGYKATVICGLARILYPYSMVKTEHGLPEPMSGRPLSGLRDRLYRRLDAWAARKCDASVCYVTKELQQYYANEHRYLEKYVIPNGTLTIAQDKLGSAPEIPEDCFSLVIVGRVDTVKGHHFAIEALANDDMPIDVNLYIVGTGPCEHALLDQAKAFGVESRVHFLGFRRNVLDYIAKSQVLLMPSLHEGLPYTLLEAMALGAAIIASRVGGLEEVLENNATALLVPVGNPAALAEAIIRLHNHEEIRTRIGKKAMDLQRKHYSLSAMVDQYINIYQGFLTSV